MSVIIGVCGLNFGLFIADKRMVTVCKDKVYFKNDDTEKIIRLNEHVVFGATGIFDSDESIDQPFLSWPNVNDLDFDLACQIVKEHCRMITARIKSHGHRAYIIGGKTIDGKFKMCNMRLDSISKQFVTQIHTPTESTAPLCYCISLPPKAASDQYRFELLLKTLLCDTAKKNGSIDDLIRGIQDIIAYISDIDETVGKTYTSLLIK